MDEFGLLLLLVEMWVDVGVVVAVGLEGEEAHAEAADGWNSYMEIVAGAVEDAVVVAGDEVEVDPAAAVNQVDPVQADHRNASEENDKIKHKIKPNLKTDPKIYLRRRRSML